MASVPKDFPSFHDGYLKSITLKGSDAVLGLERSDNADRAEYEVLLKGIGALHAEDFRECNIIFAIELVSGREPSWSNLQDVFDRLFPPPHPAAEAKYHEAHAAYLVTKRDEIARGDAVLVSMSTSLGCDLVAFCSEVICRRCAAD